MGVKKLQVSHGTTPPDSLGPLLSLTALVQMPMKDSVLKDVASQIVPSIRKITLTSDTLFGRECEVETALPTTVGRIQERTRLGIGRAARVTGELHVGRNSRSRGHPMPDDIGSSQLGLSGYEASTVEDAIKYLMLVGKWVNRLGSCLRYAIPKVAALTLNVTTKKVFMSFNRPNPNRTERISGEREVLMGKN